MSAALTIFAFNGETMTVLGTPDAPLFVASEVCEVLGIAYHRDAVARLDDDEKTTRRLQLDGWSQAREVGLVTEPGLYRLIFRSRKPEALAFFRRVTHEVLPAIRKTGRYATNAARLTGMDALIADAEAEGATPETMLRLRAARLMMESTDRFVRVPRIVLARLPKGASDQRALPPGRAIIGQWLAEQTTQGLEWTRSSDLYAAFVAWCPVQPVPSLTAFGKAMLAASGRRRKSNGHHYPVSLAVH